MSGKQALQSWQDVLDFWFPDDGFWTSEERHSAWIKERMQGGMDARICADFAALTAAAAMGDLDHWQDNPRSRLALILVLDQFPRSLWRDTPAAFGQDCKATRIAMEGIRNGHFRTLKSWEQIFFVIAIGHCEGPDHLQRFDLIEEASEEIIAGLPDQLAYAGDLIRAQNAKVRGVIERFGRHPHRNKVLGRISTRAEEDYINAGVFPHLPNPEEASA